MHRKLPLYLALLLLTQCSKCKNDPAPADPASQLPPATQTGARTFGCLINGQVYVPKGNVGTPNVAVIYDPSFRGGALGIETYRIDDSSRQFLTIDVAPITASGDYSLALSTGIGQILYTNTALPPLCGTMYDSRDVTLRKGNLKLTRFDMSSKIIAGTFEVTIARKGCDTLRITQGRFDARF